jgi:uncharacterized cupredoxin-like copper-binding protein
MKKLSLLALFAIFTIVLTACGGGQSPTKLKVTMSEFKYDMENYTVAAGKEITMDIKNDGAVGHEFVIMKKGLTIGEDFGPEDEENIYWEVEVEPGKSTTTTFTAPADPGEYQVVCGTQGHFKAGMVSKLTVVP